MRILAAISLTVMLAAAAVAQVRPARQTYASADVDADKNLRIVTSDNKTIVVSKSGEFEWHGKQIGFVNGEAYSQKIIGRPQKRNDELAAKKIIPTIAKQATK